MFCFLLFSLWFWIVALGVKNIQVIVLRGLSLLGDAWTSSPAHLPQVGLSFVLQTTQTPSDFILFLPKEWKWDPVRGRSTAAKGSSSSFCAHTVLSESPAVSVSSAGISCLCVSGICAQLCYWVNLQTGKRWAHPPAWARTPGPWGLSSSSQAGGSWAGAAGGGASLSRFVASRIWMSCKYSWDWMYIILIWWDTNLMLICL